LEARSAAPVAAPAAAAAVAAAPAGSWVRLPAGRSFEDCAPAAGAADAPGETDLLAGGAPVAAATLAGRAAAGVWAVPAAGV
jgi:hypothetical protein